MKSLLKEIQGCQHCQSDLPFAPHPIIQVGREAKLLIIGQAPGLKAHQSQLAWNDASGDRLREWLGLSRQDFYNDHNVALMPMGFCYPGKGKSGDTPPMPACAPLWHNKLRSQMTHELTLLVGQYAQDYYLPDKQKVTTRVENWRDYLPNYLVLPHPSPRNNIWLKRHPW